MNRARWGADFGGLALRSEHALWSWAGDSYGSATEEWEYVHVCKRTDCEQPTRKTAATAPPQRCGCGEDMLSRRIESGNRFDPITHHTQDIWACPQCQAAPPHRKTTPPRRTDCRHAYQRYAIAARQQH